MANYSESLVSVIVPCFQQERFIAETLESVRTQSYPNWECIVVDDGSTDDSKKVIEKFVLKDARISYVYQKNKGVSAARNLGFVQAKGEFINFLDGDDLLRREKLRHQVEYLNANPDVDWCYCDHVHRYEEKGIEEHYERLPLGSNPLNDFLFHWDRELSIPLHCGIFRHTIWAPNELPFAPNYAARWEDWLFWIDLGLRGSKPRFLQHQDTVYRIHASNYSSDPLASAENMLRAAFYIAPRLPSDVKEKFIQETISFVLDRHYVAQMLKFRQESRLWKIGSGFTSPIRRLLGDRLNKRLKALFFE